MKPALNKHQQWRAVKLKNDMQVLIISDENADQSAAAMNVGIGKRTTIILSIGKYDLLCYSESR